MASPSLEDLFDDYRITSWDWMLPLLVFYTPVGLLLLLVRVFTLVQFYLMFIYIPYHPIRKYILKMCSSVLGIIIQEKHTSKAAKPDSRAIWVCNHCSPFDWIVLQVIGDRKRAITFPEGETTSGRSGLLKFQSSALEQYKRNNPSLTVQPVSLRISRPFPDVSITHLDAPLWTDAFFMLFSPCTVFNIRFLEPTQCREDEDLDSYVSRLELAISQDLGVTTTSFTAKDKLELVKRRRVDNQQPAPSTQRIDNTLQVMAGQVKEVLPHVPLATIIGDLRRTNNVDATVANLVEGVVPFVPEPVGPAVQAVPSQRLSPESGQASASAKPGPALMQFSTATYGKSAQERGLSLQERKQRLLQEARLRYCERHGLQIPGINC